MSSADNSRLSMIMRPKDRALIEAAKSLTDHDDTTSVVRRALELYARQLEHIERGGKIHLVHEGQMTVSLELLEARRSTRPVQLDVEPDAPGL